MKPADEKNRQQDVMITELLRENETLSRQVKRLIKAETRLYAYQEELDSQLKEYKDLYLLNRRLGDRLDMSQICNLALDYIVQNLNYERALWLQLHEETGRYHVHAMDGYYEEEERTQVAGFAIEHAAPFLAPLMAGGEYLLCQSESQVQELTEYRAKLRMNEYFVYPLGEKAKPQALLAVGNTAENARFYRRVTDSDSSLLSIGNLVGAISSSMENYISFHRMEESERKYRQLSEVLEQRVGEAVDELRRKDKILIVQSRQAVMGEMISNIAHQWRQPLNLLGLLAQEMQMMKDLGELSKEFIDTNVRKTMDIIQQMSRTIDDFRNFFQPDREKVDFKVCEAIDRTVSLLAGSFKARQIRTEIEQKGDPVISGYPGEFSQVLVNLLINARDALISRQVADPRICITLFMEESRTVVTVADNAGGVPEEILDRIFEPYFTTKGLEQGTGIGLFMCKTIIEKNMHGALSVRNTGEGAEFRIEI